MKTAFLTEYTLYKSLIIKESLNCTKAIDKAKKQNKKRDYGNAFKKCKKKKKTERGERKRREERNMQKIQEVRNVTFIMHRSIMRDQVLIIKTNGRMLGNLKGKGGRTGSGLEWDREGDGDVNI